MTDKNKEVENKEVKKVRTAMPFELSEEDKKFEEQWGKIKESVEERNDRYMNGLHKILIAPIYKDTKNEYLTGETIQLVTARNFTIEEDDTNKETFSGDNMVQISIDTPAAELTSTATLGFLDKEIEALINGHTIAEDGTIHTSTNDIGRRFAVIAITDAMDKSGRTREFRATRLHNCSLKVSGFEANTREEGQKLNISEPEIQITANATMFEGEVDGVDMTGKIKAIKHYDEKEDPYEVLKGTLIDPINWTKETSE